MPTSFLFLGISYVRLKTKRPSTMMMGGIEEWVVPFSVANLDFGKTW